MNERHRTNQWTVEELRELFKTSKLRLDLVPAEAIREVAKVITYGSNKYEPNAWQQHCRQGLTPEFFGAALRHISQHQCGEVNDPETGLSHVAHAVTNLLFILWDQVRLQEEDSAEPEIYNPHGMQ